MSLIPACTPSHATPAHVALVAPAHSNDASICHAAGFSRSQVEAVAALANLELSDSEIELFAQQLGDILDYANQVQKIDTTGVPPTASVVTRHSADRAGRRAAVARSRPTRWPTRPMRACEAGLFRVPRVIG